MGKVRVLLADDHAEIREIVADMLKADFDIVGSVANGREGLAAALRLKPDILIADISMPLLDGIQLASQLQTSGCRTKILFLTVHRDCDYVETAFSAGACGYVLKPRVATDLIAALRAALEGRKFTSDFHLDLNYA